MSAAHAVPVVIPSEVEESLTIVNIITKRFETMARDVSTSPDMTKDRL